MPTTASSPTTTLIPASHTALALVRHCNEVHRVGPIQSEESRPTNDRAPLEPALLWDPPRRRVALQKSRWQRDWRATAARWRTRKRSRRRQNHITAGSLRSQGSPRGIRWIGEREVDWTDTADCDDRRFILAADHAVVMRSSGHAVHEAAGRRRHARSGVEISAAIDPPTARDNDAEPIAPISMRRAHVSRMPADKDIVEAWRSAVPGQRANVGAALRKRGLRFPLQRVGQLDDGLRRIERTGGRTRWPEGQRRKK
jgi:hypothetical protein